MVGAVVVAVSEAIHAVVEVAAADLEEIIIIVNRTKTRLIQIKINNNNKDKSLTRKAQRLLQTFQLMHVLGTGRKAGTRPTARIL